MGKKKELVTATIKVPAGPFGGLVPATVKGPVLVEIMADPFSELRHRL